MNQLSKSVGAGNPHATFCGNRGRATASGDPVGGAARFPPIPIFGIIAAIGTAKVVELIEIVRDEEDVCLPKAARLALAEIADQVETLTRQINNASGNRCRPTGAPNREDSPPIRRSQTAAISRPPPMQTPAIAATTGSGHSVIAVNAARTQFS